VQYGLWQLSLSAGSDFISRFLLVFAAAAGVLSSSSGQRVGAPGVSAAAAAAGVGGEDEPLVLALAELLAVRRCAEPSLPEGGGIWVSSTGVPTVSAVCKEIGL
jgi:hypothetical protein